MSFFMSLCASATKPMYTTASSDNTIISMSSARLASGVIGRLKRRKPYPPSFSMIAARITEPPVGASTCASGNHVCTGTIGILTAKAARKARKIQNCSRCVSGKAYSVSS